MNKFRAGLIGLLLTSPFALAMQATHERPVPAAKVTVRIVVFTESDGSNPAASHKQIDQQITQLRADGARHGLQFVVQATTFVADSQKRHADADALTRPDPKGASPFPCSKDSIVLYVTGLTGRDSTGTPYVLRSPDQADAHPAIIIDASQFGGQGCGPGKDAPCRALSLALAEALTAHTQDAALRDSAANLKTATLRTVQD